MRVIVSSGEDYPALHVEFEGTSYFDESEAVALPDELGEAYRAASYALADAEKAILRFLWENYLELPSGMEDYPETYGWKR